MDRAHAATSTDFLETPGDVYVCALLTTFVVANVFFITVWYVGSV